MRRIALYDVDSKIPNLALMKISTFHKDQGDNVEPYIPLEKECYDLIYASKIFNFSDGSMLDPKRMDIGGTGWDITKELPDHIEELIPDYSIYDYPHNIGFTMRGCRLKCSFCVVPEKEGKPRPTNTISELWTQRLSDYGCDPYAMPYNKEDPYQKSFTRWVNHKAIFNSVPWEDYRVGIHKQPPISEDQQRLFT